MRLTPPTVKAGPTNAVNRACSGGAVHGHGATVAGGGPTRRTVGRGGSPGTGDLLGDGLDQTLGNDPGGLDGQDVTGKDRFEGLGRTDQCLALADAAAGEQLGWAFTWADSRR